MSASPALRRPVADIDPERARAQIRAALARGFAACGGVVAFTRMLNDRLRAAGREPITRQACSWWQSEGSYVDPWYWPHIEAITDLATTRRHLRPDIYGFDAP